MGVGLGAKTNSGVHRTRLLRLWTFEGKLRELMNMVKSVHLNTYLTATVNVLRATRGRRNVSGIFVF